MVKQSTAGSRREAPGISDPGSIAVAAWQPFRGPFQRWPRSMDALLAIFAFFMTMLMWFGASDASLAGSTFDQSLVRLAVVLAVIGSAALYWRRRYPVRVHAVIVAGNALALLGVMHDGLFATVFSLYSLGRYASDGRASLLGLLAALLVAVFDMFALAVPDMGSVIACAMMIGLWSVGRRLRLRGEYLRLLEERAEYLERSKSVEAQRAVAEERTRIARELHDVVAHQVSLMTVQAGAAKTVARADPDAAASAMAAVEGAGRQALGEMRQLLNVLRPPRGEPELAPQPGLQRLPHLAAEVSDAGVPVAVSINGEQAALGPGLDLALYRIVQESLTNVLKHAGAGAEAQVRVDLSAGGVHVCVTDDGCTGRAVEDTGHGIRGMRERAELLGGWLEAGPRAAGGFRVSAWLPRGDARQ